MQNRAVKYEVTNLDKDEQRTRQPGRYWQGKLMPEFLLRRDDYVRYLRNVRVHEPVIWMVRGHIDVRRRVRRLYRSDEPITSPVQRLNEFGVIGVVEQCSSNPSHRVVDKVLKLDDTVRPQRLFDILAGHELTRMRR